MILPSMMAAMVAPDAALGVLTPALAGTLIGVATFLAGLMRPAYQNIRLKHRMEAGPATAVPEVVRECRAITRAHNAHSVNQCAGWEPDDREMEYEPLSRRLEEFLDQQECQRMSVKFQGAPFQVQIYPDASMTRHPESDGGVHLVRNMENLYGYRDLPYPALEEWYAQRESQ